MYKPNPKFSRRNSFGLKQVFQILAFIGLLFISTAGSSQCSPLPGTNQYSRSINQTFSGSLNWLQADYDNTNSNTYLPGPRTIGVNNTAYWANVHSNGVINIVSDNSINNTEATKAVKLAANGDVISAGNIIVNFSGGNHTILFLMRTTSTGSVLWCEYFQQTTTTVDNHVVVTETSGGDIVAAASTLSGNDDIIIVRTSSGGALRYYDDHPIALATNLSESHPSINGITATYDNGFVLVGSSGYNGPSPDFIAAIVLKYDASYSCFPFCPTSPALNWNYIYRSQRAVYSFSSSSTANNSASYANGVVEDASTHALTIVGYTANCDQNGLNGTYETGFIFQLSSAGALSGTTIPNFSPSGGYSGYVRFNGVSLNGATFIVTGSVYNTISNYHQTLITSIDASLTSDLWAYVYGTSSGGIDDEGFSVFPGGNGFISVGITNEAGSIQPQIIATDGSGGSNSCNSTFSLNNSSDNNDVPMFNSGSASTTTATLAFPGTPSLCDHMSDICGSCSASTSKSHFSYIMDNDFIQDTVLQADYDNTTNTVITATTINVNSHNEVLLSKTNYNGTKDFAKNFYLNGTEKVMAVKQATWNYAYNNAPNDLLVAGTMKISNKRCIFLMRLDSAADTVRWFYHYDQSTVSLDGFVVLTETTGGDIVAVASCQSGSNHIAILRTDYTGAVRYYDDYSVFAAGNLSESHPYIRAITADDQNGYAICGSTGDNGDFSGALVLRYDSGYSATHTLNWHYIYRNYCPSGYNLSIPSEVSISVANAIQEDANGLFVVAGYYTGYEAENNTTPPTTIHYRRGLAFVLSYVTGPTPTLYEAEKFKFANVGSTIHNDYLEFNGLLLDGSNYILTGAYTTVSNGKMYTLTMSVTPHTTPTNWPINWSGTGNYIGSNSINYGWSIFKESKGYMIVGYSNDNSSSLQPNILSVSSTGTLTCSNTFAPIDSLGNEEPPTFSHSGSVSQTRNTGTYSKWDVCGHLVDDCIGSSRPLESGIDNNGALGDKLAVYPNPAANKVFIDLTGQNATRAVVTLMDIQGKEVANSNVEIVEGANHFGVDISGLQPGFYFIKIVGNSCAYPVVKFQKN